MAASDVSPVRDDTAAKHEGVITGLLGGTSVAVFFLLVDIARGKPLMTPSVLGEAFIMHAPTLHLDAPDTTAVIIYTIFHFAAFIAFGLLLSALVRASETSALARYAVVQVFVTFEVFFYGILSLASELVRGMFPFWAVLGANSVAALLMGGWLWRHHPVLRSVLAKTPLGATEGRS